MSLEEKLKQYMQDKENENLAKSDMISNFSKTSLPLAILFCSEIGYKNASVEQIGALFDSSHIIKLNFEDEELDEFSFIDEFIRYVHKSDSTSTHDVFLVFNASDKGILPAKITGYFEHIYFVKNSHQLSHIEKISETLEAHEDLVFHAQQTRDDLWTMFHVFKDELNANGVTMEQFELAFNAITDICYKDDVLSTTIEKLVDELRV
jgi:hypothetical protein